MRKKTDYIIPLYYRHMTIPAFVRIAQLLRDGHHSEWTHQFQIAASDASGIGLVIDKGYDRGGPFGREALGFRLNSEPPWPGTDATYDPSLPDPGPTGHFSQEAGSVERDILIGRVEILLGLAAQKTYGE